VLSRFYDWLYRIIKVFRVPIHVVFGTHPELAELVESGRLRRGRAIDLGCGAGREAIFLAREGFDVTGVDISPTAIGMAEKAAIEEGVEVSFLVDDLTDLSRVKGLFDLLVDYGALNDLNQQQRDGYMRSVLPLAADPSQFVLLCFDKKLPRQEVDRRFEEDFDVRLLRSKTEAGFGRGMSIYLMKKR
jgi:cyclopropane fatty-acyl-phospholipid synthase-like methyltransferase